MIKEAGIQPQEGKREIFRPQETVHVEVGDSLAVVVPSDSLRISCTIHYGKPGLDAQFLSLAIEPKRLRRRFRRRERSRCTKKYSTSSITG